MQGIIEPIVRHGSANVKRLLSLGDRRAIAILVETVSHNLRTL